MKINILNLLAIGLLAVSCQKKAPESETNTSPANTPIKKDISQGASAAFHTDLEIVASYLDTDGVHFSMTNVEDDLTSFVKALDKMFETLRENEEDVPEGLNMEQLIRDMGINDITAYGSSSKKTEHYWHNRMFVKTGGSEHGLLSLMGGKGSSWSAAKLAPAETDMVLEMEVNLKRVVDLVKAVAKQMNTEDAQQMLEQMDEQLPGAKMKFADMLGKMDVRLTMMVMLDNDKQWILEDKMKLPSVEAVICLERGTWIWQEYGSQIEEQGVVSEKNGLKIVAAPESIPTPMGEMTPAFIIDEKNDRIWLGTNLAKMEEVLASDKKLGDTEDFKKITHGLPAKGNMMAYVSSQFSQEIEKVMNQMINMEDFDEDAKLGFSVLKNFLNMTDDILGKGYAWTMCNNQDGVLFAANSPMADKNYSSMVNVFQISAMAGFATPLVLKQLKKADMAESSHNMKMLYLSLIEYDLDNDGFPKDLEELVTKEFLAREELDELTDGIKEGLTYIPGYSTASDARTVILHTAGPIDGSMWL